MSKLVVLFWMIFGSFIIRYSNCFSLKTFDQNSISLTFSDSKFVQLSGGQLVRELNCTYNCKIKVKEVTCNRQDDTLIWICNSLSLDKSNYVFNSTLIVCDNYYSSNTNQSTTNCFMQYSLKCKYKEFDFVLLLVILLCFVLIAMFIEFLKKMFGCYTPIIIGQWKCKSSISKQTSPELPLRTAFSSTFQSLPADILTTSLTQDLNQDHKGSANSTKTLKDNYI